MPVMSTTTGPTWADFSAAEPEMADVGRATLDRDGTLQGLLATVNGDALPRINPVWVGIVDGRLYLYANPSAKQRDLAADGRYALHSMVGPTDYDEFSVRGRAVPVIDPERAAKIAAGWYFAVNDSYALYELTVEHALLGRRKDADEWPPRYTSWKRG